MAYDEPDLPLTPGPYTPGIQTPARHDRHPDGAHGTEPETGLVSAEGEPYRPGGASDAGPYDRPGGSQGTDPEHEDLVPSEPEPQVLLIPDPDDSDYGLLFNTGPLPGTPGIAALPAQQFDIESGDYVIVPVDED